MCLKVLIADDDINIINILKGFLIKLKGIKVVGEALNGADALKLICDTKPDVVFLDIDMPGMDGISVGRIICEQNKDIRVIFITGFGDFRDQAFMMHAFDYIEKPIIGEKVERIVKDLKDVKNFLEADDEDTVFIKSERNKFAIRLSRIIFLEKCDKKVRIYTDDGEYEAYNTMEYWQNIFEERNYKNSFLRVHRSYIINLSKIKKIHTFYTTYEVEFYGTPKRAFLSKKSFKALQEKIK